jgi:phytoene synthase
VTDPSPPNLSPCGAELRRHDPDRFLTALFAPSDRREALFALYAFNLEVARTREMVREPMLGRMRLQWWRDTIEELYEGTPRRHYVVDALAQAFVRRVPWRPEFDRLIDARELDMEGEGPPTIAALIAYVDATSASLVRLALEMLDDRPDESLARQATHVGVAWGLAGLLRAVPFHARHRRLYLPADLVAEAGLNVADLFELRRSPALSETVRRIADIARTELAAARALPRPSRAALPALLPGTLAAQYLARLAAAGHDPFDARVQARPPWSAAKLVAAQALRRI